MRFSRYRLPLALAIVLALGACDLSGINENPNEPETVPENLQLSGLLSNFSYQVVGGDAARTPAQWVQHIAANTEPPSEDNYDHKSTDVNNLWEFFSYTAVMNNARILAAQSEENGNFAYTAIAKTILAWNLGITTDLWGDIPWSEAFDPSNTTPAYDAQEEIYEAVYTLLNEAIAAYDQPSPLAPGSDDLLYGGNMEKWERLTHTLLARFYIHLTEAPGNDASQRAQQALDALASGFQSNDDDADFQYFDAIGAENPWYQWTIDSKWVASRQLSQHHVELLKTRQDPRLPIQARQAGAVGNSGPVAGFTPVPFDPSMYSLEDSTYVGHANGVTGVAITSISSIGTFYSAAGAPLNWISYAEAKFIEAEATLIRDGAAAADAIYRDAIAASMDKLGVSAADRDAYLAARPALTEVADPLEELMTEKYIAGFLNHDAYNDWRRTGYPELTPAPQALTPSGDIPLRYPHPQSELNNNAASVDATGVPRGFAAMDVPVWWDTTP